MFLSLIENYITHRHTFSKGKANTDELRIRPGLMLIRSTSAHHQWVSPGIVLAVGSMD